MAKVRDGNPKRKYKTDTKNNTETWMGLQEENQLRNKSLWDIYNGKCLKVISLIRIELVQDDKPSDVKKGPVKPRNKEKKCSTGEESKR